MRESDFGGERRFRDDREERRQLLESLNNRVAGAALRHHFENARIPFQCECGDIACRELALLAFGDYQRLRQQERPLLADVHEDSGG